jgi:hypothetical protein
MAENPLLARHGGGVIWDGMPFETPVIPAKAGTQSVHSPFPKLCRVDSSRHGGTGMTAACNAHVLQMTPVPGAFEAGITLI